MPDRNSTLIQNNPRPKLQGRPLSNWSRQDIIILLLILGTLGLTWWLVDYSVALVLSPMLIVLYRRSNGYGRFYYDAFTDVASMWRDHYHKGIWWRADDTEGPRFARWLRQRHPALPAQFVRIHAEIEDEVETRCILHQTDMPYDQFYIAASGGAFASADVNDQTRLVTEMNSLFDQIIAQSGLKAGISHLRITGPFNQMKVSNRMKKGMSPTVAQPDFFELDEKTARRVAKMRENAKQITMELEKYRAAETWSLIVITVKRRFNLANLTARQVSQTPIIELGQALMEGLRENGNFKLQNIHSPSLSEAALIARSSWDVVGIHDYFRRRESDAVPKTDEQVDKILENYRNAAEFKARDEKSERKRKAIIAAGLEDGAREIDRLLEAWPQKCIETNGKEHYLRFDDNYIAILRVTELPKQFRSDQIMSVHTVDKKHWTRFSFVSESISGETQTNMLIYKASLLENINKALYGRRILPDPRRSARSRNAMEQVEHMSVNTIAQMANCLITVVERDPQRLRRAVKTVSAKYGRIGFKTQQVKGSARLINYFFSGALAANRI